MEAAYLGVARFRKPHGLKGDAVVWVLTDEPEKVLVKGRKLTPVNDDGNPVGEPLEQPEPFADDGDKQDDAKQDGQQRGDTPGQVPKLSCPGRGLRLGFWHRVPCVLYCLVDGGQRH